MERVLIRAIDLQPTWSLVFEMAPTVPITATVARGILGDRVPVIAWDDSGPDGALVFPGDHDGFRLAQTLRHQLNDAIAENVAERRALAQPCPAETFPEPGAPDVDADDFAEPAGGESARVAAEEAAHDAALRAAATAVIDLDFVERHRYHGWASGDRFVVHDKDDVTRTATAVRLWPTWGERVAGHVITRCEIHHTGHDTSPGLLVDCEGLARPLVVAPCVLSACARKVTS